MEEFLIDELKKELETCEILMNDQNLDEATIKKYEERYFEIISKLADVGKLSFERSNSKKELYIKGAGVCISAFGAITSIFMMLYDRKWTRNMIHELTEWEKDNTFTSSAGKMLSKNIIPKRV